MRKEMEGVREGEGKGEGEEEGEGEGKVSQFIAWSKVCVCDCENKWGIYEKGE